MTTRTSPESDSKIVWMMDETIARAHPQNWREVISLEHELIQIIGAPELHHQIVSPLECLPAMIDKLHRQDFSCIFDLTGWLTPVLQELFPFAPIINEFAMSRVRTVSSPSLETAGYILSMTPEQIQKTRQSLDLSRPLIVDDVSFSGWTSAKTMEIWHLNPENTAHAFLIANTGKLSENQSGAVKKLERLGSKVIFGYALETPKDDGWHLKDLHEHPKLEEALEMALNFQSIIANFGMRSEAAQTFLADEKKMRTLFPDYFTSREIEIMIKWGIFIPLKIHLDHNAIHAKNPFLWASPYFQKHVKNPAFLLQAEGEILRILKRLRSLTSDPEITREVSRELALSTRRILVQEGGYIGPERR